MLAVLPRDRDIAAVQYYYCSLVSFWWWLVAVVVVVVVVPIQKGIATKHLSEGSTC
jgi:hypothetical protein